MRNTLTSAAVGAAVAVVVAGTVGLLGIFDKDKRMVYATISLDLINGNCYINTIPQTLEVRKKETVEWTIVDRCGVTLPADGVVTITFRDGDPTNCTKTGKKSIKCAMKTDPAPDYREYKYAVSVGAITEDPVLEIVQ